MSKLIVAGMILGVSLLGGCGGGGDGVAVVAPPTARPIVSNTLRTFLSGDTIQYNVTGTVTAMGVVSAFTGTGSYSTAIAVSPLDPAGVKRSQSTFSLSGALTNGAPFTATSDSYFSQTASGTMNIYGDSASGWITVPVTGFVPSLVSPIIAPASWVNNYTQQNGDITAETITVVGKTTVTTGLGVFEAYQYISASTVTLVAGGTDVVTETSYVVPSIGPVKIVLDTASTDAAGAVMTTHFVLEASTTNIAF